MLLVIKQSTSECLSSATLEAMGLKLLETPAEVSSPTICKTFYEETNAKACVSLEELSSLVESKTKKFASEYAESNVKILKGLDTEIQKFAEAKKKIDEASESFDSNIKSAFNEAENYIGKFDSGNIKEMRDLINKCNLAQQTNSFGMFCLLSSDLASEHVSAQSVLESGLTAISLNISPASAIAVADKCADSVKNTCMFLEVEKAVKAFDKTDFSSGIIDKCSPDLLSCVAEGQTGDGCADSIKTQLFENFCPAIGTNIFDENTKELFSGFSSDASELYDKLDQFGFGEIKEGAEGSAQTLKGFVDNFSVDEIIGNIQDGIKDNIGDVTGNAEDLANNIGDSIKNAFLLRRRILEANMDVSFKVKEGGYDCYENGEKSGFENYDDVKIFSAGIFIGLLSLFYLK